MNTPICDFVERYAASGTVRLHMPGHKGAAFLGCERLDLTEIEGADSLYCAQGIIRESEENAAALFGTGRTLYSTEGSSQCIRAMLYLAMLAFGRQRPGVKPVILAARNVHKAFLTAAALLDFEIVWLFPENQDFSLCRCGVGPAQVEAALEKAPHAAGVYLTSPDYLGNTADIAGLAEAAHRRGVPLLVDNAHGAYRRFLAPSRHPISLGADVCCDSAHKTLPVLTGGAYLHIAKSTPEVFHSQARAAMAMFGSTSPSYLILQSLDRANRTLSEGYADRLAQTVSRVEGVKARLARAGWRFAGDEPLKITIDAKEYGYTGGQLAGVLKAAGIAWEYADPDYLVLMPAPENPPGDLERLTDALLSVERKPAVRGGAPGFVEPVRRMPVRKAMFLPSEPVDTKDAAGRTAASLAASCPPAISPAVPGEVISENTVEIYQYYGIDTVSVLLE